MKIIFLDVDGVLNNPASFLVHRDPPVPHAVVDRECVQRLKRIVDATGARIVLSSTWRFSPELVAVLTETLAAEGIPAPLAHTPIKMSLDSREAEIRLWLREQTPAISDENFIILDDIPARWFPEFAHRLVNTNENTGLTDENVKQAIQLLTQ